VPPSQKALLIGVALVGLALLCWRVPLFHVVPLTGVKAARTAAAFDAARVAVGFWEQQLPSALERAPDAKELLVALAKDPGAARKQFGRTFGISSSTLFVVKGTGHVSAVEPEAVVVAVDGTDSKVSLATGLVFGSAVRDATGMLDVSAYANSQDFNQLSAQLNALVETRIAPVLREAASVGKAIRFAGCAELDRDEGTSRARLLWLIPVRIEWP
jgi:predicted lipoprotein